jgi:TadE-like protein
MGKSYSHQHKTSKKGQSLVEFAAGITILLIILAGVVDVGRALSTFITYRDAAEEAASFGAMFPTYCIQIEDRAFNVLGYPPGIQVNVHVDNYTCAAALEISPKPSCLGHTMTVEVKDPHFDITMPFLGAFIGTNHFPLSATVRSNIIRTPCGE